jgi:pimeloyl-ACP methyl ester carboxylesterase
MPSCGKIFKKRINNDRTVFLIPAAISAVGSLAGFIVHIVLAYSEGYYTPSSMWNSVWLSLATFFFSLQLTYWLWQGYIFCKNVPVLIAKNIFFGLICSAFFIIYTCYMLQANVFRRSGEISASLWAVLGSAITAATLTTLNLIPTNQIRPEKVTLLPEADPLRRAKADPTLRPNSPDGCVSAFSFFNYLISTIFLILLAFMSYQAIATSLENFQPVDQSIRIDAGGYPAGSNATLSMQCSGTYDSAFPVIVMEAGFGNSSAATIPLQQVFAQSYYTCVYDRAGYGFSTSGIFPRTTEQIVAELYQLLERKQVPGPYLFVGREEGGQISKAAAMIAPASTAGLVLIDSYPFTVEQELEGQVLGYDAYQRQIDNIRTYDAARAFEVVGFSRWIFDDVVEQEYPIPFRGLAKWNFVQNKYWNSIYWDHKARMDNWNSESTDRFESLDTGVLGNLPLLVLSSDNSVSFNVTCEELQTLSDTPSDKCEQQRQLNKIAYDLSVAQAQMSAQGQWIPCLAPCPRVTRRSDWIYEQFQTYFTGKF